MPQPNNFEYEPVSKEEAEILLSEQNQEVCRNLWQLLIRNEKKFPSWDDLSQEAKDCWTASFVTNYAGPIANLAGHIIGSHHSKDRN